MDVLLHVGHRKTCSSYIQQILALNTDTLLEKGIYYPESRHVHTGRTCTARLRRRQPVLITIKALRICPVFFPRAAVDHHLVDLSTI